MKMFRMFRLPKLIRMLDLGKFNKLLQRIFDSQDQKDRIFIQYLLVYSYRIFRLIIIVIIITYFMGCLWFLLADKIGEVDHQEESFIKNGGWDLMDAEFSIYDRLIISCYFALTTLSTVGYGDFYPISDYEMLIGIVVMLMGVAFFSYIMGSFIEIISNYDKMLGPQDQSGELHNWMSLLTRFTNNRPLPKNLIAQIDNHFQHFWAHNRLSCISKNNEYLNALPRSIKRSIMVDYLFDDVFYKFRFFFNSVKYIQHKFLYDIAFGFKPRRFDSNDDEKVIYDEEDDVSEMYLIDEGQVSIGYYMFSQGLSKRQYKTGIHLRDSSFICDY